MKQYQKTSLEMWVAVLQTIFFGQKLLGYSKMLDGIMIWSQITKNEP